MSAYVFGKLPAHGDFVARGLSPDEQARWDDWLSHEIDDARAQLGTAFSQRFDCAPVWRFVEAQGAGAMAPSVDSVGRRFPIVAGVRQAAAAAAALCEERIYDALVEGWTADRLHAALPDQAAAAPALASAWWTEGNDAFSAARLDGERPRGLMMAMLDGSGTPA